MGYTRHLPPALNVWLRKCCPVGPHLFKTLQLCLVNGPATKDFIQTQIIPNLINAIVNRHFNLARWIMYKQPAVSLCGTYELFVTMLQGENEALMAWVDRYPNYNVGNIVIRVSTSFTLRYVTKNLDPKDPLNSKKYGVIVLYLAVYRHLDLLQLLAEIIISKTHCMVCEWGAKKGYTARCMHRNGIILFGNPIEGYNIDSDVLDWIRENHPWILA